MPCTPPVAADVLRVLLSSFVALLCVLRPRARAESQDLVFYADFSADANIGSWVEATYKVAGVYKASNDLATIVMTSGEKLTIRRTTQTGTLLSGGVTYPISDQCTGTCSMVGSSRRLSTDVAAAPVEIMGQRRLGFFSALQTSGTFTMMASTGLF